MSELEFACEIFGVNNVMENKIPRSMILSYMNDWKESRLPFKTWKMLLKTRG